MRLGTGQSGAALATCILRDGSPRPQADMWSSGAQALPHQHPLQNGFPASNLAFAGRVYIAPVAGLTHGHELLPKKAGFEVRYIEFGIADPSLVLCQCCEFVRKS